MAWGYKSVKNPLFWEANLSLLFYAHKTDESLSIKVIFTGSMKPCHMQRRERLSFSSL